MEKTKLGRYAKCNFKFTRTFMLDNLSQSIIENDDFVIRTTNERRTNKKDELFMMKREKKRSPSTLKQPRIERNILLILILEF